MGGGGAGDVDMRRKAYHRRYIWLSGDRLLAIASGDRAIWPGIGYRAIGYRVIDRAIGDRAIDRVIGLSDRVIGLSDRAIGKDRGIGMTAVGALSRIGQVSMRVHDLDRAIAFYRDALGLPFLFKAPPQLAFFDCAGVRLLLDVPEEGAADHPSSVLYFAVDDIEQMHALLVSRGVSFRRDPHLIARLSDREVWMAFFDDSEGNTLALMAEPRF